MGDIFKIDSDKEFNPIDKLRIKVFNKDVTLEELEEIEKQLIGDKGAEARFLREDIRKKYLWLKYHKGSSIPEKDPYDTRGHSKVVMLNRLSGEKDEDYTYDRLF